MRVYGFAYENALYAYAYRALHVWAGLIGMPAVGFF